MIGFLRTETGGAGLLMAAAVAALAWANLSESSYGDVWGAVLVLDVGGVGFRDDLEHLVNDGLMAVFFYVVALEVKRELLFGSLRDRSAAAAPVAAALGTMVGAAVVYLAVNLGPDGEPSGWAIPIATDIAFALGVLGLAGRRAPRELRAFLLTLAVVDDLGTILVIALFFGEGVAIAWLAGGLGVVGAIVLLQRRGVRSPLVYAVLAAGLWLAAYEGGVHPTIAGVALGFLTPASALERLEHRLAPWSALVVLPVFALANAGVPLSADVLGDALSGPVGLGILLGLVVGAPIGGFLLAWSLARTRIARVPNGLDWGAIAAVTPLKGIGFTVAIFISVLAFEDPALQEQAKLAILAASLVAAVLGLAALSLRARRVSG